MCVVKSFSIEIERILHSSIKASLWVLVRIGEGFHSYNLPIFQTRVSWQYTWRPLERLLHDRPRLKMNKYPQLSRLAAPRLEKLAFL